MSDRESYKQVTGKLDLISRQDVPDTNVGGMIRRQEAIDVCNSAIDLWHGQLGEGALVAVKEGIEGLPSAKPERKKGKWIYKHCVWFCSECGENPTKGMGYVQGQYELYNFCPNCGCQMNGGEQNEL